MPRDPPVTSATLPSSRNMQQGSGLCFGTSRLRDDLFALVVAAGRAHAVRDHHVCTVGARDEVRRAYLVMVSAARIPPRPRGFSLRNGHGSLLVALALFGELHQWCETRVDPVLAETFRTMHAICGAHVIGDVQVGAGPALVALGCQRQL